WLRAGVSEDGQWSKTEVGTPQGAVISPLLANVYLHYVFDLWVQWWRTKFANGRCRCRALCRRFHRRFPASPRGRTVPARASGTLRPVRAGFTSRQNAAARVWAVRRRKATQAWGWQTGDLRFSGLHSHL